MCLIALMPAGKRLEEWEIRSAFTRNDDGFGIMMPKGDGTLRVQKIVPKTVDPVIELYNSFAEEAEKNNVAHAVHFRFKTHGETDLANAHPFRVLRKEKHGIDLYMMHNGVISSTSMPKSDPKKSDTWHFIHHILRPTLKHDPQLIYDPKFQRMLEMAVGYGSKLTFMDHEGSTIIINKTAGTQRQDGIWLSNSGAIVRPYQNSTNNNYYNYNRHWRERFDQSHRPYKSTSSSNNNGEQKPLPFDPATSPLIASLGATGSDSCPIPDPLQGKYYDTEGKWDQAEWKKDCDSFFLAFENGDLRSPSGEQPSATSDTSVEPTSAAATAPNLDSGSNAPSVGTETGDVRPKDGDVCSTGAVTCKDKPGTAIADCEKDCDCSTIIDKSRSMSVMNGGSQLANLPFSGDDTSKTHLSRLISTFDPKEDCPAITTEMLCELDEDEILDLTLSFPEAIRDYIVDVLHFFDHMSFPWVRESKARSSSRE